MWTARRSVCVGELCVCMGRLCSGKHAAGDDISGSAYTGTSTSIVPLTRRTHPEWAGRAGGDAVGRGGDG